MIDNSAPCPGTARVTDAALTRKCCRSNCHSASPKVTRHVRGAPSNAVAAKRGRVTSTIIAMAVDRKSEAALARRIRLAKRGRAGFELQPRQARIDAVTGDERGVIALLDHATGLHYQNSVGLQNRRKPMRDH